MPPNNKKKKPVANPARGFATTSIASKPKADRNAASTDASEAGGSTAPTSVTPDAEPQSHVAVLQSKQEEQRDLHELNPEELERQLEESEIQLIVEKNAQKVQKDTQRQLQRCQTDRRLLRGQANYLSTRQWLPEDLITQILDLARLELGQDASAVDREVILQGSSEETFVIRLWTLQAVLLGLHLREDDIRKALQHILKNPPREGASSISQIWGLDECLEWLVLESGPEDLLDYERDGPRSGQAEVRDSESETPASTHQLQRSPERPSQAGKPNSLTRVPSPHHDPADPQDDIDVSDLDSDLDPSEMLSTYLSVKTRLFEIRPDLAIQGEVVAENLAETTRPRRKKHPHRSQRVYRNCRRN